MNRYRIVMKNGNVYTTKHEFDIKDFTDMILCNKFIEVDSIQTRESRKVWLNGNVISSIEEDE